MSGASWYSQDSSVHDDILKGKGAKGAGGGSYVFDPDKIFRFYMKKGDEPRTVMLLDDAPFNVWMHQFPIDGNWGNFQSCPKRTGLDSRCPLCEQDKYYAKMIGNYTILDITGWEKDGQHFMGLKILPANSQLVQKLERERKRRGTLQGAMFEVSRDGNNALGDDWVYIDRVSPKDYLQEHFDEIVGGLNYLPEGWAFWKNKEGATFKDPSRPTPEELKEGRHYRLQGFPFEQFLKPKMYDELAAYIASGGSSTQAPAKAAKPDSSFEFGANAKGKSGDYDPFEDTPY